MHNNQDTGSDMSKFPEETPLAMCYVPWQNFNSVYSENTALEKGTVFPDLYFPFMGKGAETNGK